MIKQRITLTNLTQSNTSFIRSCKCLSLLRNYTVSDYDLASLLIFLSSYISIVLIAYYKLQEYVLHAWVSILSWTCGQEWHWKCLTYMAEAPANQNRHQPETTTMILSAYSDNYQPWPTVVNSILISPIHIKVPLESQLSFCSI